MTDTPIHHSLANEDCLLLDSEELAWIKSRYPDDRYDDQQVALAVTLKYFQQQKSYHSHQNKPPELLINCLASQLGCHSITLHNFDWHPNSRTMRRFRKAIREKVGYSVFTKEDGQSFIDWLKTTILPKAPTPSQLHTYTEDYFTKHKTELPQSEQLKRHINRAQAEFESRLFGTISKSLDTKTQAILDELLIDDDVIGNDGIEHNDAPRSQCNLYDFKQILGTIAPYTIKESVNKLKQFRDIKLPQKLFKSYSRKLLLKYHQRVMVEHPGEIKAHPKSTRYAMLAIFCHVQQQQLVDTLTQTIIDTTNRIIVKAQAKIKKDIINEVTHVKGKFDILYDLAQIAADSPDGVISKTIYPTVAQKTLTALAKELKHRGHWYEQTVKAKMHSLYSHHHRQLLLPLLKSLTFHAQHTEYKLMIKAVHVILEYAHINKTQILLTDDIPIDGVISKAWQALVIKKNNNKIYINRLHYELAVLEVLQKHLDCKSIWVEEAYRYRDPNEDLPQDFYQNKEKYFKLLDLSMEVGTYINEIKQRMHNALGELNNGLPTNKKVKIITKKDKPWIRISTSDAQEPPSNIEVLKSDIIARWPSLALLDLLKETAIRTKFTKHFHTVCDHEILSPEVLQKRLLLCLHGIGTNAGLKRISSGNSDATYNDLRYIRRRFITPCRVRAAIAHIVNKTLALRDPAIWGDGNVTLACDSTKVNIWDQNLISQWHARYKSPGVMIYWHVDKKSLCIYSQLKTCSSSEVASMIQGVLHHDTNMDVKEATMDTHGQSLLGFAFSDLLHFDLLPRIKGIQKEKLYLPDEFCRKDYEHLDLILGKPIDWQIIDAVNYDELVRYAAALKLGTVDSDIILKRFKATNYQHPVYKALIELGKAIKTIFLCRYLHSEDLRIDINASQNIVERVNGFMGFIFYGKLGEISTNKPQDQELAVLCLHLLQASLSYMNTVLIQKVLSTSKWKNRLTSEDKRAITPLIHGHINPYGLFPLDMKTRIDLEHY